MAVLEVVIGSTIACSYILFGNAITQSFMGVPALLVEFPAGAGAPGLAARAGLLGRQWPVFWRVGNRFFRPISTFGIVGYGSAAVACFLAHSATAAARTSSSSSSSSSGIITARGDWRVYALAAACHAVAVVHSAVNMQPVNEQIDALGALGPEEAGDGDGNNNNNNSEAAAAAAAVEDRTTRPARPPVRPELAETYAHAWIRYNRVRLITPALAGTLALTQILGPGVTTKATMTTPAAY